MKATALLLFFATIAVISALPGFSDKICTDYFAKTAEGGDKCCYIKYKTESGYYYNCVQVTMSDFYNIKEYRDSLETSRGWDIKSIECDSSSYLYASLLLLLVFLF